MLTSYLIYVSLLMPVAILMSEQTIVIFDNGETRSLHKAYQSFYFKKQSNQAKLLAKMPEQALLTINLKQRLPYTTSNMRSGLIASGINKKKQTSLYLLKKPLFLLGPEQYSYDWLVKNKTRLMQIGAVGILVAAKSESQVTRIALAAKGLKLFYFSAYQIAKALDLKYYPLVIYKGAIWQ